MANIDYYKLHGSLCDMLHVVTILSYKSHQEYRVHGVGSNNSVCCFFSQEGVEQMRNIGRTLHSEEGQKHSLEDCP